MLAGAAASLAAPALSSALPVGDYSVPAARDTEPVVLTGKDFADWGTRSNVTAKAPLTDVPAVGQCLGRRRQLRQAQQLRRTGARLAGPGPAERHPGRPAARLPLGRHALRADPIPGRRDVHSLSRQLGLRLRLLLRRGSAHDLRVRPRGLPVHRARPDNPCLARPANGQATTPDPVSGPRRQRRARLHGERRRRPRPRRRRAAGGDRGAARGPAHRSDEPGEARVAYVARPRRTGPSRRTTPTTATSTTSATQTRTCSRSPSRATTTTATPPAAPSATRTGTSSARTSAAARATTRRSRPTATSSATTAAG